MAKASTQKHFGTTVRNLKQTYVDAVPQNGTLTGQLKASIIHMTTHQWPTACKSPDNPRQVPSNHTSILKSLQNTMRATCCGCWLRGAKALVQLLDSQIGSEVHSTCPTYDD